MKTATTPPPIRKVAAIAVVGTSIEWYDFYIYGTAAALVFPALFFPADLPPLVGLIAAFSTFAVGFLARPLGGILFGHFGDRVGRKKALVVALFLMGGATSLIGALPTYATVGIAAPLALIFLRFCQGLAIGGQWGGAALLMTESAPPERRGFFGSFAQLGVPAGVVLANLAFLLISTSLSQEQFMAWGWRLPFLLSVVLVLVAAYVQHRLEETPVFRELQTSVGAMKSSEKGARDRSPVLEAIKRHPKEIVLVAGAFMALQVCFFILITFVVAYGSNPAGLALNRNEVLLAVMVGAVFMAPSIVASAAFSDKYGRRPIYLMGAILLGLWAFAFFPLIETKSLELIVIAIVMTFALMGLMHGPQAALISESFGAKVRYSGASLGYQLGGVLGGGFAPLIATALVARFGGTFAVSLYIATACAITAICVTAMAETHKRNMHNE